MTDYALRLKGDREAERIADDLRHEVARITNDRERRVVKVMIDPGHDSLLTPLRPIPPKRSPWRDLVVGIAASVIAALLVLFLFVCGKAAFGQSPETHPQLPDLSAADIIDILTDYSLVHEQRDLLNGGYYGYTDPKTHRIHVVDYGDRSDKRDTVIHEMLHIRCHQLQMECEEEPIAAKAAEIYRQLFVASAPQINVDGGTSDQTDPSIIRGTTTNPWVVPYTCDPNQPIASCHAIPLKLNK